MFHSQPNHLREFNPAVLWLIVGMYLHNRYLLVIYVETMFYLFQFFVFVKQFLSDKPIEAIELGNEANPTLSESFPCNLSRLQESSDNNHDLSISFHLISSQPHFQSHRWLRLLFQIYNRDFNARRQFHCQLEFCLSMEFSKLNILTRLRFRSAELTRPGDQNDKAAELISRFQHSETCSWHILPI